MQEEFCNMKQHMTIVLFFVWKLLAILICTFYSCQASDKKRVNGNTDSVTTIHQVNANMVQKETFGDSVEAFFRSQGVLVFKATDKNLNKSFELLNKDGSLFATLISFPKSYKERRKKRESK
jgi:hypothetical protein